MTVSRRSAAISTALLLAATAFILSAVRLHTTPAPYTKAEVCLLEQATLLTRPGPAADGHRWPVFFHIADEQWLQPVPVYVTATWLRLSGSLAADTGRVPGALVAIIDALLMFAVARALLSGLSSAIAVTLLLILAPAHFIHGRLALDALAPVPFVLAWLACLLSYLDGQRTSRLVSATLCLGIGVFTTPHAVLTMVAYLAATMLVLWHSGCRDARRYATAAAGFALPLVVMVPWFVANPKTYVDTMGRWGIHAAHVRFPLEGVRAFFNYNTLSSRVWLYWDGFSPRYLFLTGGPAEGRAGVVLWPTAVFVAVGVHRLATTMRTPKQIAVLAGLVAAPVGMVMFGDRQMASEELAMIPFVCVLAGFGLEVCLASRWRGVRVAAVLLLVLVPAQFTWFATDYFTGRTATAESFGHRLDEGCARQ